MKLIKTCLLAITILMFVNCAAQNTSLTDAYKKDFYIGTALSASQIEEKNANEDALWEKVATQSAKVSLAVKALINSLADMFAIT